MENTDPIPEKKPFNPFRFLLKAFLWSIGIVLVLAISAVSLVFIYQDEVKSVIIGELNKNLRSEVKVDPKNIDLTFISSFPKCALQFKDVLILEAIDKKERDTLIFASDILLMFNLRDLWNKNYTINKISIREAQVNLHIDKQGKPNYIFWKQNKNAGSEGLKFALEKISFNDIRLNYRNSKEKVKVAMQFSEALFSGKFGNEQYTLESEGKAKVKYLQQNKSQILKQKDFKYTIAVDINKTRYLISKAELAINEMNFSVKGNCNYGDSLESANLNFSGEKLDIASVLSLLPDKFSERISDYKSEGNFFCTGNIKYLAGEKSNIAAEFGIQNATVKHKQQDLALRNLNVQGKLGINEEENYLNLQNVSARLGNNTVSGFCLITNLADPYLNLNMAVNAKLEEVYNFWPIDTLEYISGDVQLNTAIKGNLNEMKRSAFSPNVSAEGSAYVKGIKAKFKAKENEINISGGSFTLNNRDVMVNDFKMLVGGSDIELNGRLPGFVNYLFDSEKPLMINAALRSNKLILEDVLYGGNDSSGEKINIPANLDFNLNATIADFHFAKFEAQSLSGDIAIKDRKVVARNISLNTMDGHATLDGIADTGGENIKIKAESALGNINISKLFSECNNFGQNTLNDRHLKGFATANLIFSGNWSKTLDPDLESVVASGSLTIIQGRLMEFKPLESLSRYIEVNELKDIKFSALQSSFDIKNQVISFPKTSLKNSALNIEFWGKHNFNNAIDYHIKLLLSELIASKKRANKKLDEEMEFMENDPENRRCVYVLMTGTVDDPIIKYDHKGLKQKIGEDIKAEKQNLKQMLKDEFGLFKKDTVLAKTEIPKVESKFKIESSDTRDKKKNNTILPPKKKEDDDDF